MVFLYIVVDNGCFYIYNIQLLSSHIVAVAMLQKPIICSIVQCCCQGLGVRKQGQGLKQRKGHQMFRMLIHNT